MNKALLILFLALLTGCAGAGSRTIALTIEDGRAFVGRVDAPARTSGAGVLLLGGGYAHDADWSVPGSVMHEGENVPLTINGEPHADAPALVRALTARGFVVVRTSTVPVAGGDMEPVPLAPSVELAAAALRALRAQRGVERVYLVGHSLGATRAALIADADVDGIVTLAGAYLSRTPESPRALSAAALASADAMASARDLDGDGVLRGWEAAAGTLIESDAPTFREGLDWPIDRLRGLGTPVLAIFGGLDPISVHGPTLSRLPNAEVVYVAGRGHNLGPESDEGPWGRVGPMDAGVVERLVDWLAQVDAEGGAGD